MVLCRMQYVDGDGQVTFEGMCYNLWMGMDRLTIKVGRMQLVDGDGHVNYEGR